MKQITTLYTYFKTLILTFYYIHDQFLISLKITQSYVLLAVSKLFTFNENVSFITLDIISSSTPKSLFYIAFLIALLY